MSDCVEERKIPSAHQRPAAVTLDKSNEISLRLPSSAAITRHLYTLSLLDTQDSRRPRNLKHEKSKTMTDKLAEIVLKDFAGAAGSYFSNARVPASVVSGSSLGALFALSNFGSSAERSTTEKSLIKIYRIVCWTSFVLALNAVITSTIATTSILHGGFDPMAETAYLLLKREFEYHFVSVRWSMTVALLLFVDIVAARLILEFDMLRHRDRRDTARFILLSAVALQAHLLSIVNETLYCWSNLAEMTVAFFRIIVTKAMDEPSSMGFLSMASALAAAYYGIRAAALSTSSSSSGSKQGIERSRK
jgi:hypothetical protein